MNIKEYAVKSKIPLKTLRWMVRKGFISELLTEDHLYGLLLVEKLWSRMDFVRPQVRQMNIKNRKAFIETCDLETKWERSAYSRMKTTIEAGEHIVVSKIIDDLEFNYLMKFSYFQKKRIYQLRDRVKKENQRAKKRTEKAEQDLNKCSE
jgi:ribosomal protein S8